MGYLNFLIYTFFLVVFLYSMWQIDISVGAMQNFPRCVTTDAFTCINALEWYHTYLSYALMSFIGLLLFVPGIKLGMVRVVSRERDRVRELKQLKKEVGKDGRAQT